MKATAAALRVETLKFMHSPVGVITTLGMLLGTLGILVGITAGITAGNAELIAKAGQAASPDWDGLLAGATQITAVMGILGSGAVLAWAFGREFADGTVVGLFALPVSRGRIALAKLVVHALWTVLVGLVLALGVLALGLLLGRGAPGPETWEALARLWALTVLSGGVATVSAWIATSARSPLAAVGGTIAIVVIAQVGVIGGAGGWMPLAAPALWAMSGGRAVSPVQLVLSVAVAVGFAALTCRSWARLQLDR